MTGHTWTLLAILAAAIAALILLINSRLRFHPFVALMVVSIGVALAAGQPSDKIAESLEEGAGGILGNVGVTLAFGAMLGRLLASSGATDRIARLIVDRAGARSLPWYVAGAAFVIGIPMFFEIGLIVLLPLVFSVAQRLRTTHGVKGSPYVYLAAPAIAALSTLHGMVPPHPGPLIAVDGLHASLGTTILVGLVCAIPTIIVAGPVYGRWIAPRLDVYPDRELVAQFTGGAPSGSTSAGQAQESGEERSGAAPAAGDLGKVPTGWALAAVLVPVALMLLRTLAELMTDESSPVRHVLSFTGEPVVAMLAGFLFALFALGYRSDMGADKVRTALTDSMKSIAGILLIIAGGGAFNQVLEDSGIGKAVESAASGAHINVLVLGWFVALLLSFSTGSATVGIVAATGILAPMAQGGGDLRTALLVVAIGAGSIGLNYVNHAGFWLVKESFGMTLGQATKSHTAIQTIVSVCGLLMALLISVFA
ncbi:GntP family permease [Streptomyces tsukubensis]|uniref:Gluconate transporter n=1 Tax=Streptomyces tsukubensis TaxID=83656 RepID=A0A1V4AGJ9_9ACTN|nr:gluconate:H+ symporter [Streptomyces tsukubensis]OON82890.1 gluconate transporter [Streptomyces tsukubensis]QFR91926.1 gluconate transporter [Streptomyces tsukubensis]